MADELIEIRCPWCGHTWYESLAQLGQAEQVIYRGAVEVRSYRMRCPTCGTRAIVTVEVEEERDDQGQGG